MPNCLMHGPIEMSLNTLIELWGLVLNYGMHVRENGMCGLESWNKLKKVLKEYDVPFTWSSFSKTLFCTFLSFGLREKKLPQVSHAVWERDHYMIQHGRIPERKSATLISLLQVAYNAGQASVEHTKEPYEEEVNEYYKENKLNNPLTYIKNEDISMFNFGTELIDNIRDLL